MTEGQLNLADAFYFDTFGMNIDSDTLALLESVTTIDEADALHERDEISLGEFDAAEYALQFGSD